MGYCWKCGAKLEPDMSYCPKCGAPVAREDRYQPVVRHYGSQMASFVIVVGVVIVAVAVIFLAIIALGLLPSSQFPIGPVIGSGNVTTQQFDLTDFTSVDAGAGFNVEIVQASTYAINITTDSNIMQYIEVTKSGSTLHVGFKPGLGYQTTVLRAQISMPDLQGVEFSGGVIGTATGFNMTHNFSAVASGGSSLTMTGQALDLNADCSGGGNLHLGDFLVNNASVNLSGGSQATIYLNGRLDADLSGGAQLFYKGNPTLGNINTSGGSSISRVDGQATA